MDARELPERFADKIEQTSDGCWQWTGTIANNGYGHFWWQGKPRLAHRLSYTWLVGPIPAGMQLDHLCHSADPSCPGVGCRHQTCVNPTHLEPVTALTNAHRSPNTQQSKNRAKTHCPQGHPYAGDNLYVKPCGRRVCRTCAKAGERRRWGPKSIQQQRDRRAAAR